MDIYDSKIKCNIDELTEISFPFNERVGLEIVHEGVKYEFLLNLKENSDYLIFAGSGARAKHQKEKMYTGPWFHRWSWDFNQSIIYYNDPTSYIDGELLGAWGVGTKDYWPVEIISLICNKLGENLNFSHEKFVFYGSSMGGFISILLATLNKNTYFVADIPQINLLKHWSWPGRINKYCFPELTVEEMGKRYGYRFNIFELMKREKYIPKGLMIFDVSFKGDVDHHYNYVFEELSKLSFEDYHNELYIQVMGKNRGHNAYHNVQELLDVLYSIINHDDYMNLKNKNILQIKDISDVFQNKLDVAKQEFDFVTVIQEENELLKNQLVEHRNIINSHQQVLNTILCNKPIRATGLLRKLQLHNFELLKFIVNVCEKYGFDYWLDFGSLVGAFRHDGIIPWDDDIDTSMPREDYEKFVKVFPKEISRFEGFSDKVIVRLGSSVFKHAKLSDNPKCYPILQFIYIEPFAVIEIYPCEYVDLKDDSIQSLNEYRKLFYEVRSTFKENYTAGNCSFEDGMLEGNKRLGIVREKTEFMACSIDGAPRKPVHISNIYPLRKVQFEGCMLNIPNKPFEYLSAYYGDDVSKIPRKIHHHNTPDVVKRKLKNDEDVYKIYDDAFLFLKNINENF